MKRIVYVLATIALGVGVVFFLSLLSPDPRNTKNGFNRKAIKILLPSKQIDKIEDVWNIVGILEGKIILQGDHSSSLYLLDSSLSRFDSLKLTVPDPLGTNGSFEYLINPTDQKCWLFSRNN